SREDKFKKTGTPICKLYQVQHWYYSVDTCTNCCLINKYNDIVCDYCKANNIEYTLPKEITSLFEFGEFREIEKKYTKKRKLDINELKANEHSSKIDSNEMLLDNKTPLEIFKENKNKIPYCSEKSGLVTELFSRDKGELYANKPTKQQNNWWNRYEGQQAVLLEFYTKINWNDMINMLNDTPYDVEIKHK
ncbi:3906_t:CDS:2, partial [Racocetra persica]